MSYLTRAIGATKLLLKAKSPTIMVVGGVAAMGIGTITASKQTLKVEEVLTEPVRKLENIKATELKKLASYPPEAAWADRVRVYTGIALDLGKLYFVPIVCTFGGAAMVFSGHRIMLQRNATLAVAFTGLKKSFDLYRERVIHSFGDETDQAMLGGWTGVVGTNKKTGDPEIIGGARDWEASGQDPYNRVFEQGASESWQNDLGVNKMFIAQQQRFAQELLNRRGHLYLSEVYTALGFPESDISRVVGWKIRRNPDGSKDFPMVDFGLDKAMPDDWKYSQEKAVYLDFNCQGLIVGGNVQKVLERA